MVTGYASKELIINPREATLTAIDQELTISATKQNLEYGVDYNQVRANSSNSTIVEVASYSTSGFTIRAKANGTATTNYILQLNGVEKYRATCYVTVNVEE